MAKFDSPLEGKPINTNGIYVNGPNCAALAKRVSELEEALRKIVNPIAWFQQEAEKTGDRLDGMTAHRISEDPHWLKQQAQQALAALAPQEGE
jgi:hypothetical protein